MNGFELIRLQANQVKKSGDTMTGPLNFTSGNGTKISHNGQSVLHRINNQTILATEQGGNIIFRPNGINDDSKQITINSSGDVTFNSKATFKGNGIEIFFTTPYIDFHFNNSNSDYTSRIIEKSEGKLDIEGDLNIGGRLTSKNGTALYAGPSAPANPQVGDIWIQV